MTVPVNSIVQLDLGDLSTDEISEIFSFQQDANPSVMVVTAVTSSGTSILLSQWTTLDYIVIHNKSTTATVTVAWTGLAASTPSFAIPAGGMAIWSDAGATTANALTLTGSAAALCELTFVGSR